MSANTLFKRTDQLSLNIRVVIFLLHNAFTACFIQSGVGYDGVWLVMGFGVGFGIVQRVEIGLY